MVSVLSQLPAEQGSNPYKVKMSIFFITQKNQDLKKAVLYGGGWFTVWWMLGLHSGGSVCLSNLGGSCLHSRGSWGPGVPSLHLIVYLVLCSYTVPSFKHFLVLLFVSLKIKRNKKKKNNI